MYKVMFVCTGNTCRSPMAEYIMRHKLNERGIEGIEVFSCGIYASEGKPMSENSAKSLLKLGIPYNSEHKSRAFSGKLASDTDLILFVTDGHKSAIPIQLDNAYSLREFVGVQDVGDPYGGDESVYMKSAQAILESVEKIIDKLTENGTI